MGQHLPPDSSGELCDEEEEEFDDETDDLDKVDQDGGEILSSDEENAVAYDEDDDVQVAHATKRVHEVEDGSEDEDVSWIEVNHEDACIFWPHRQFLWLFFLFPGSRAHPTVE